MNLTMHNTKFFLQRMDLNTYNPFKLRLLLTPFKYFLAMPTKSQVLSMDDELFVGSKDPYT